MVESSTADHLPEAEGAIVAPMAGVVVRVVAAGTVLAAGGSVAVLESMKMEHPVSCVDAVLVARVLVRAGETVTEGQPLALVSPASDGHGVDVAIPDPTQPLRGDLAEARRRHQVGLDPARPQAVAKRRSLHRRTARENIAALVDPASFVEYGPLVIAAQQRRRSAEDLMANTPADGLIAGIATINAALFGAARAEAVVMSYDYSVLAGTQGMRNHSKMDRILELALRRRLPVVLFPEGGGGRPGDVDSPSISGLEVTTFHEFGRLSGRVPLVAIVSGRCFAGNAALLGMCDVVIATPDANIGMAGPAMIVGGGLGTFSAEDIGPVGVQRTNGVVHVVAADESEAIRIAKRYLAYFQGDVAGWTAPDDELARAVVPENRLRAYDARAAIAALADVESILELRGEYGTGIVTALARVAGRPFGFVANNTQYLGGAIDATAADKLAAFLTLCDGFGIPIVSLCDTPGFMVGPEAEKEAGVTRLSRLFIVGARLSVPLGTIILRKGYGLGAQAMAGGSFRAPQFVVAWPSGEIGGMGLEGAVRLGFRKELDAVDSPEEREVLFRQLVDLAYERGKALTAATAFEVDDVIDPADSRRWILTLHQRTASAPT